MSVRACYSIELQRLYTVCCFRVHAHPELFCIDALNITCAGWSSDLGQEVVNLSQVKCSSAVAAV